MLTSSSLSLATSRPKAADEKHPQLAALFGVGRDGLDTFGNTGNLRVPVGSGFASTGFDISNTTSSKSNQGNPFFNGQTNSDLPSSSSGFAGTSSSLIDLAPDLTGAGSTLGQSRNPFGQSPSSSNPWTSPKSGNQRTLNDLMQDKRQQQILQAQQTGMGGQPGYGGFGQPSQQTNGFGGSLF
jgi:epsin